MREYTPEELAAAKAQARAATGKDHVEEIRLFMPGEEVVLLVRPMLVPEYADHVDATIRHEGDAAEALLVDFVLWPERAEVERIVGSYPGMPGEFAEEYREIHGVHLKLKPTVYQLAVKSPRAVLDAAKLSPTEATRLLGEFKRLVIVRTPAEVGFSCVMDLDKIARVYAATKDRIEAAGKARRGVFGVCVQAVRDAIVWSSEPIDAAIERVPGIFPGDLLSVFLDLGGLGARRERKSV